LSSSSSDVMKIKFGSRTPQIVKDIESFIRWVKKATKDW